MPGKVLPTQNATPHVWVHFGQCFGLICASLASSFAALLSLAETMSCPTWSFAPDPTLTRKEAPGSLGRRWGWRAPVLMHLCWPKPLSMFLGPHIFDFISTEKRNWWEQAHLSSCTRGLIGSCAKTSPKQSERPKNFFFESVNANYRGKRPQTDLGWFFAQSKHSGSLCTFNKRLVFTFTCFYRK